MQTVSWSSRTEKVALAAQVALDVTALAVVRARQPKVPPHSTERTKSEIATASVLFDTHAWSSSPATYHRRPPGLLDSEMTTLGVYSWPRRHELVAFASGFRPRSLEPGADRWPCNTGNDTVFVRLLRHRQTERPWVVCLHGFGMGASRFDLTALWANYLHVELGFNVAVPVLPFHGPRRSPDCGELLSLDLVMTLHGISQAIWDIRRLVHWINYSTGAPVGVYGVSLGGYLAALLAGIERLDCVVAGIPFANVLGLMAHHRPPAEYAHIMGCDSAENAFQVVSPLAITPVSTPNQRALFVARGDRFVPANQSVALAHAWEPSPVYWHNGGHIGCLWSRKTKAFVGGMLREKLYPSRLP
jgi:dienelactone hydrolase